LEIPADFSEILKTIKPQENAFQWKWKSLAITADFSEKLHY
jgi:hypothetical protein